jgi:beta-glucosidase/6-phospho-beta-glucosidase/beta-galactosidase/ABC-type amino acid transport substrate-binding protein
MNWTSVLTRWLSRALPPLPESFLFGVATADHQCEAYDPQREDIRDIWEEQRKLTRRGSATDFANRYAEDIELARRLGCKAFRFSIAWSRLEPERDQFDDAAFEHYGRLIGAIRSAGMEPILTLHHFTWPVHVEQGGGLIGEGFPETFARYVQEVVNRLGQRVGWWITFNEPSQLIYGYIKPWWVRDYFAPPGLPEGATLDDQIEALGKLIRNLFMAHTEARRIIRRANPAARVGANPLLLGLPIWLQRFINWNATRMHSPNDLGKQARRLAERALLEQGQVDVVMATLTRTPEREQQVMFSEAYFVAGQRLLVRATDVFASVQDLQGWTIAVVKGSTAERGIGALMPQARVRVARDYATALRMLDQGQADAILADDTILQGLMAHHTERYRLIGERLSTEPYAAAVTRGNQELLDVIDVVVRRFSESGAWAASYARHFGQPGPEPPPLPVRALSAVGVSELTHSAAQRLAATGGPLPPARRGSGLRRIQDRGHVIVAVKQDVPGLGYRDPRTGELSGLEIDLARALAQQIFGDAGRVRFRPAKTAERIPLVRSLLRVFDPLLRQYSIFSTVLASNWWHLGMAGKLDEFLCPLECVGQQDYVGLDYYWGIRTLRLDRIQRLIDAGLGRFDRAPVWPGALYDVLRYQASLFPDLPLLVVENGSVDVADGIDRASYLREHLRQVQQAVRDGVRVAGYVCWSITSNREWGLKFSPSSDFGLYHIDLDHDSALKRVPTPAVAAYREIIARRGA